MRCPDCGKFVSLELQEPEIDLEIDAEGKVSGSVRIVRNCADCGQEMKEFTFDVDEDLSSHLADHMGDGHDLTLEVTGEDTLDEGGIGRAKSYFGADIQYEVRCSCAKEPVWDGAWSDKVPASHMEELV